MNNAIRFWMLKARYQKAKHRAERYLRKQQIMIDKGQRELDIMETVFDEQKKILREMDIDEVPCDP